LGERISAVRILEFTVHESLRNIGVRTPTNYRPTASLHSLSARVPSAQSILYTVAKETRYVS